MPNPNQADRIKQIDGLADWLDSKFRIPGTNIRFGLDSLVGLIPFAGDSAMLVPQLLLIGKAYKLGVSKSVLSKMLMNVGLDWLVGSIPVIGDIYDVFFKSSRRNADLVKKHFEKTP
ncbi:MAG: DUF4112 domain-containing protein [Vibrio sp.]